MANCSQTNNTTIIGTSAVSYDSTPLPCTDVKACDDLNTILTKFDNVICSAINSVNILSEEIMNITEDLMIITEEIENINDQIFICCPICDFTVTATELPVCEFTASATELPTCNFTGSVNQVPDPTTTSTSSTTSTTTTEAPLEEFIINAIGVNQIYPTVASLTPYGFQITASLPYYIDWGDGIESFPAGTSDIFHTYSSPYTGQIKILSTDLSSITEFKSETNPHNSQSLWTSTSELQKLDQLDDLRAWPDNGLFITGNVLNLPSTLTRLVVYNNDLTGLTSDLPQFLTLMGIYGVNTISGDTSGFPNTLNSTLDLQGNNTVSGDTSDLPRMLTTSIMIIKGQNTISGDTSDLPSVRQLRITGNNTISGSVSNLPISLVICEIDGDNTISGSISTGSASTLPPNIQIFLMLGNSAVSGNITTLPLSSRSIRIEGSNTLTGDLFLLPPLITGLQINGGNNTFSYSSSGRTWASNYTGLFIQPASGGSWAGFNSTETDNLLNDIQPSYINTSFSNFTIKCGSIPKRTSVSDTAYNALVALIGAGDVVLN
jgi:hypothetical protein